MHIYWKHGIETVSETNGVPPNIGETVKIWNEAKFQKYKVLSIDREIIHSSKLISAFKGVSCFPLSDEEPEHDKLIQRLDNLGYYLTHHDGEHVFFNQEVLLVWLKEI